VLAAIAGMSWPAMRGVLSKGRLRKGADDIETTIRQARVRAIRDGKTFVLRYEPDGRRYRVESWDAMARSGDRDWAGQEPLPTDDQRDGFPVEFEPVTEELPVGVRFLSNGFASDGLAFDDGELSSELASGALMQEPSDFLAESNWSEPIIFQANGRSENAAIRLMDDRRFVVDVSLRGLTGVVTSTLPTRLRTEQDQRLDASDDLSGSSGMGGSEDRAAHEGRP